LSGTEPEVFYIYLDGSGETLTPTITTDPGILDSTKNARYTAGGKRILNWIIDWKGGENTIPNIMRWCNLDDDNPYYFFDPQGIWTIRSSAADNYWYSVCYGNGLFVAVAYEGDGNNVMTSPNGVDWTIRSSAADNDWISVCYGNGLFVAVAYPGAGNRVMTSKYGFI